MYKESYTFLIKNYFN